MQLLKEHFAKTGKAGPEAGAIAEVWRASNAYEGEALFFAQGRYAVVLVNPPTEAGTFLREVVAKLGNK